MEINISRISVLEFEALAFILQCRGWWLQLSCQNGEVWIKMDKPVIGVSAVDAEAITIY